MTVKYLPSFLWALVILALCAIPGRDIPSVSWLEALSFDKWVHAGMFLVLLVFFHSANSLVFVKSKAALISVSLCVLYGGSLELMQGAFFSERTADTYDFIANSTGVIIGYLFFDRIKALFVKLKLLKFHV